MSTTPIPPIIYGTAWKKEQTESLVIEAIRQGFRGIDTACQPKHYDEAAVGRGVSACLAGGLTRADLYLQTKFTSVAGQDPNRIPYDPAAPLEEQVEQSLEASLRNLQTPYLDCLVLHSPLRTFDETVTAWRALESCVDAGRVRRLGLSNCYDFDYLVSLHDAVRSKPTVVQNRFYAATGYDRGMRAFCVDRGIVYQSFWTLTANAQLLARAEIAALAAKYARTPAQILFRYLTLERVVPLTGTKSPRHMGEDLQIFEFALTSDERRAVTALLGA